MNSDRLDAAHVVCIRDWGAFCAEAVLMCDVQTCWAYTVKVHWL